MSRLLLVVVCQNFKNLKLHSKIYQQIWTNCAFQSNVCNVISGKGLQVYIQFCLFYLETSQSSTKKWEPEDFGKAFEKVAGRGKGN